MKVLTFKSTDAMFEAMFGPVQQDEHMKAWRWFRYVFGTIEQYNLYLADKAVRRAS